MFLRLETGSEDFPTFEDNEWFDIRVCKGKDRLKQISYDTQHAAFSKAFKNCNIHSRQKTHAARGSGARYAEASGAAEDELRRHGRRWQQDAIQKHYLTGLPKGVMRTINGFPSQPGEFYLKRACAVPSESLQKRISPQVDY